MNDRKQWMLEGPQLKFLLCPVTSTTLSCFFSSRSAKGVTFARYQSQALYSA
jgi:hypothetical protein